MIAHVLVGFAFSYQVQILLDQPLSSTQKKGNLTDLHIPLFEVDTSGKSGKVIVYRLGTMMHHFADLRHGLALQRQSDNLGSMGQHRSDVMNGATQRYYQLWIRSTQNIQVPCDRTRGHEEDSVSQVFTSQQSALAQGFLANIDNTSLPKTCRAVLL
jgi:hypothetical protein